MLSARTIKNRLFNLNNQSLSSKVRSPHWLWGWRIWLLTKGQIRTDWILAQPMKAVCELIPHYCPFLLSFLLPLRHAVRAYWPHLEESDPIWSDDWSHSVHRRSPSWGFPGFSLAAGQMPGDLCIVPDIISSSLSLADRWNWRDSRDRWSLAGGTATIELGFFGRSPWLHWIGTVTRRYGHFCPR